MGLCQRYVWNNCRQGRPHEIIPIQSFQILYPFFHLRVSKFLCLVQEFQGLGFLAVLSIHDAEDFVGIRPFRIDFQGLFGGVCGFVIIGDAEMNHGLLYQI